VRREKDKEIGRDRESVRRERKCVPERVKEGVRESVSVSVCVRERKGERVRVRKLRSGRCDCRERIVIEILQWQ
jgi:hypothetical protein